MVIVKGQAISPIDFVQVCCAEMDYRNDVVIKSIVPNRALVSPKVQPPCEGLKRLVEPYVHESKKK